MSVILSLHMFICVDMRHILVVEHMLNNVSTLEGGKSSYQNKYSLMRLIMNSKIDKE